MNHCLSTCCTSVLSSRPHKDRPFSRHINLDYLNLCITAKVLTLFTVAQQSASFCSCFFLVFLVAVCLSLWILWPDTSCDCRQVDIKPRIAHFSWLVYCHLSWLRCQPRFTVTPVSTRDRHGWGSLQLG